MMHSEPWNPNFMGNISVFHATYDAALTAFYYVPYWKQFDLIIRADEQGKRDILKNFYVRIKTLAFPDGYSWASVMPEGTPIDDEHWETWSEAAKSFLDNPHKYLASTGVVSVLDWANANYDNEAFALLPEWHLEVAMELNLCPAYDVVWPSVMHNYKSMFNVVAPADEVVYQKFIETTPEDIDAPPPTQWLEEPK